MLYAIVAVLILIIDQAVKYWTTLHLELNAGVKTLIPGLIDLRNLHNSGSAFSMLDGWNGARWLFLAVTLAFAVLVILALAKDVIRGKFGRWMALGVLAGALGNGVDRCIYGYVVDMFEFAFFPTFPVFNVADIFITVCGILFCLYILLSREPFGASDEKPMRRGPGGSVVTKPAPRRVEKPVKPEKKAPAAAAPAEKPAKAAKPERPRRAKRAETPEEEDPFARLKRPVVTHESFLEMTKHKSGEDPFAEWMRAEKTEAREVTPEPVSVPEPEAMPVTEPEVIAEPENEAVAETEAAPVAEPEAEAAAEPEIEAAAEPEVEPLPEANVTEDALYSLEDILNEFRDL